MILRSPAASCYAASETRRLHRPAIPLRYFRPWAHERRPDGTASFAGEDERLDVAVVEGAKAVDPAALAEMDLNSLSGSTTEFRVLSRPAAVALVGQRVVQFTYTSSDKSQVTGRSVTLTNVRYDIPKNDAMPAVVSYRDASSEFNSQEADGFASSFRWM